MSKERYKVRALLEEWQHNTEKESDICASVHQLANLINSDASMNGEQAIEFQHMIDVALTHLRKKSRPMRFMEMLTLAAYANSCHAGHSHHGCGHCGK